MPSDRLPQAVAEEARPRILAHFREDSCIATTRIIIDVLGFFGVPAVPLPVETIVFNADAMALLADAGTAAVGAAVWGRTAEEPGGPWTVGLGIVRKPDDVGHLVVAVPSRNAIIDGSIDQASRPHKNIVLTKPVTGRSRPRGPTRSRHTGNTRTARMRTTHTGQRSQRRRGGSTGSKRPRCTTARWNANAGRKRGEPREAWLLG